MNKEDLVVITEVIGEDFNVVTGLYEWGKIDRFIEAFLERMDKNLKFNNLPFGLYFPLLNTL